MIQKMWSVKLKYLVRKSWLNIQHHGILALAFLIVCRLIQKIIPFELLIFFERSLSRPVEKVSSDINISFKKACFEDIENLNIEEYQLSGLEGDEMSTNNECYIGRQLDKVVFYAWVNYQRIYDDKILDIPLSPRQAYLNRGFTHPAYRGLKIVPMGLAYIFCELRKKNIDKCYTVVSLENRSSIKAVCCAQDFQKLAMRCTLRC